MDTLYLSPDWDLTLDASGNIAKASNPYALAQDAASEIRTFIGECYYDTARGIPYFTRIFGQFPSPIELMKSQFVAAAMNVPDVVAAKVFISGVSNRQVTGQIQVTDINGIISAAGF